MDEREVLVLGKVKSPVGVKGDVRVRPVGETLGELKKLKKVQVGASLYEIVSCRTGFQDGSAVLHFKGVEDRESAFTLMDRVVSCSWEEAPKLPDNTHYVRELLGLACYDETGSFLGTVTNVISGIQPCYEIAAGKTREELDVIEEERRKQAELNEARLRELKKELYRNPDTAVNAEKALKSERKKMKKGPEVKTFLVPIVDAFIVRTDTKEKKLTLKNIKGLMEL